MASTPTLAHTPFEDALAFLMGTLFIALGLAFLKASGLGIGGTAGLAFLAHFGAGLEFGLIFFLLNLPFFTFAYLVFGRAYLLRSILATAMLSIEVMLLPLFVTLDQVNPYFAAVLGGLLCGMGMLALIRHHAGLGGFATAAVYLQERFGWRAGRVLMVADCCVVAAAFMLLEPRQVLLSVLAVICLNLVLAFYHKPGRYSAC
ncbi:YitT family protein [Telmatospirillum sp. J64-1]|uniref:YitT family protein n=1 Tax=Telmatospirillum sp. J64-1 TaxID=2502183 RepID=UPI00115D5192|nr:YitT family protein [Telmatospirillum sp. J64-1]